MIQAHEIKVGNRFIRELRNSKGLEYDHDFVLTEEWMGKLFGDNTSIALQDLNPISLSPEIIEKLGFAGKYKSCGYNYQKDGVHISSQDTDDLGNSLENYVFHVYVDYKYEPIYFLHDLQNRFYSLTKTELNYQPK